jgi:hypothetical protein
MANNPEDDFAPEDLKWNPLPGEKITIFSAEICNAFGGCSECRGYSSAGEVRSRSNLSLIPDEIPDDYAVVCTHLCHEDASVA